MDQQQQAATTAAADDSHGDGSIRSRWRANARAMQQRIRSRLSVAYSSGPAGLSFLRQQRPAWSATATTLVAARVFKGNVVFARMVRSYNSSSSSYWPTLKFWHPHHFSPAPPPPILATPLPANVTSAASPSLHQQDAGLVPSAASQDSRVVRMLQAVALPVIGNVCHAFMHGLNRTEVIGSEKMQRAILDRPQGQALITVSNHVASMDDPLVIASMLSPHMMMNAKRLRWTLCATDRCFKTTASSAFFRCVKVLPLARGAGVHQQGVDLAVSKLRQGDWVHIFPEGSRSRDGGKTIGQVKRGIGRLVMELENVPLVVPFVHSGMQEVMPIGSTLPSICKQVTVLVGDPIELDDLVRDSQDPAVLYDVIAMRVSQRLQELKSELDQLVLDGKQSEKAQVFERRGGLWERVDWDNNGPLEDFTVLTTARAAPGARARTRFPSSKVILSEPHSENNSRTGGSGGLKPVFDRNSISLDAQRAMDIIAQQGGMMWRLQAFVNPAMLVGFAARGLFQVQLVAIEDYQLILGMHLLLYLVYREGEASEALGGGEFRTAEGDELLDAQEMTQMNSGKPFGIKIPKEATNSSTIGGSALVSLVFNVYSGPNRSWTLCGTLCPFLRVVTEFLATEMVIEPAHE